MSNPKLRKLIKQGVEVWNNWRKENPVNQIDLTGADLKNADLRGFNLSNADLSGAALNQANLDRANLDSSDLSSAKLIKTSLMWANLNNINLSYANLTSANLSQSNLSNSVLFEGDFWDTDFSGVDFYNTNFKNSKLGYTKFLSCYLGDAIDLELSQHKGPSVIDFKTIFFSKGRIPDLFFRGCGFSELDIEYSKLAKPDLDSGTVTNITYKIHDLYIGRGIEYYSCFISYSSKDQEFVQRLYDDLQNNGVRCWFDLEDIKIGEPIRPTIDHQIRLRDKLLVILSENSIQSEYVGDEVEAALEEEQKSKRLVVFPIRLDDAPLNTRDDWAAKIHRRRHIGDFSNWKDETSYKKAFEKLLRDLKSAEG